MPLIRKFLRLLPTRLASSLCYRLFARNSSAYADYFDAAPLRFAPKVRMRLNRGDWAHVSIAFMGAYELPVTRLLIESARRHPGGLLVDVGANYGYFSLLWVSLHPSNCAVAFEPAAANITAMNANIIGNGFSDRIELVPAAVGRKRDKVNFSPNLAQSGWSRIVTDGSSAIVVPIIPLDDALPPERGPIALLKIDTEGHDWEVLEGCAELFEQGRVDCAVFECDVEEFKGTLGARWRKFSGTHGLSFRSLEPSKTSGLTTCVIERIASGTPR